MAAGKPNAVLTLEFKANQDFDSFRFVATDRPRNAIELILDAAVTELNLTSLSNGTLTAANDTYMIIDGFRENLIHISAWNNNDDASRISSKNGDWKDF